MPMVPADTPQTCKRCGKRCVLRCGAMLDRNVVPPPYDPSLPRIVVKFSTWVLLKRAEVAPEGVSEGTLDPVTGLVPMDKSGILYADIQTIAVYRKVDVARLIAALLLPTPLALLTLFAAISSRAPAFLIVALPLMLISAYFLWRTAILRGHFVRVAGRWRTITIRFDSPLWRRRPFHDELMRRSGLTPSAIP